MDSCAYSYFGYKHKCDTKPGAGLLASMPKDRFGFEVLEEYEELLNTYSPIWVDEECERVNRLVGCGHKIPRPQAWSGTACAHDMARPAAMRTSVQVAGVPRDASITGRAITVRRRQ